ncbi:MAG: hypothetical protein ACLQU1_25045 [Bryobacteraceae bacterium]
MSKSPSEKQLQANRANAARSTGPRTTDGKTRSAQNARKHGLTAAAIGAEERDAVDQLKAGLVARCQPLDAQELLAVERIARAQHALLRASRLESGLFTCAISQALDNGETTGDPDPDHTLADGFRRMVHESSDVWKLCLRYQAQAQRNYRLAVQDFDRLKAQRPPIPNEPVSEPESESPQPLKPEPNEPEPEPVKRNNFRPRKPEPPTPEPVPPPGYRFYSSIVRIPRNPRDW